MSFLNCSPLFLIGVSVAIVGSVLLYFFSMRRRPATAGEAATKPSAAWIVFAALFLSAGLILSGSTMWQGDCVAAAGRCPVASDGSGYPCASPGAACKVGWSAGKCKTESSTVWGCTCECR